MPLITKGEEMKTKERVVLLLAASIFAAASVSISFAFMVEEPVLTMPIIEPICVVWEDATGYSDTWITLEEILELEPAIPTSCGILVAETEERIYLAMDYDGEGYYAGISTIPAGWIISRTDKEDE